MEQRGTTQTRPSSNRAGAGPTPSTRLPLAVDRSVIEDTVCKVMLTPYTFQSPGMSRGGVWAWIPSYGQKRVGHRASPSGPTGLTKRTRLTGVWFRIPSATEVKVSLRSTCGIDRLGSRGVPSRGKETPAPPLIRGMTALQARLIGCQQLETMVAGHQRGERPRLPAGGRLTPRQRGQPPAATSANPESRSARGATAISRLPNEGARPRPPTVIPPGL